eukprot:m.74278 g.74278  ORF g.74278 m.74278 type:complete len:92 (-) comp12391_c0_seq8:27-302(-)
MHTQVCPRACGQIRSTIVSDTCFAHDDASFVYCRVVGAVCSYGNNTSYRYQDCLESTLDSDHLLASCFADACLREEEEMGEESAHAKSHAC